MILFFTTIIAILIIVLLAPFLCRLYDEYTDWVEDIFYEWREKRNERR